MVRLLVPVLLFLASTALWAAPVATLTALEGEVTVLRGGVLIPSERVGEAFALEAFDTVSTGLTGRVDVRLVASLGVAGSVRLDNSTALYLDATTLKKVQTVGLELLAGGVSVRLGVVAPNAAVEVRSEVGTFGGTGPAFRVVLSPMGDALVMSTSGKVFCRVEGRTVFIEPGSVAEATTLDRSVQTLAVNASTVGAHESTWLRQRNQALRDQAAVYFRALAARYQLQGGLFQRAWDRLERESKDERDGAPGAVANLRRAAFLLERSLYRVQALRALYDDGGLSPSVELNRGYAAKDFFRQAALEREPWSNRLAQARGFYRTQADRHGGEFPSAADGFSITYDSAFFR